MKKLVYSDLTKLKLAEPKAITNYMRDFARKHKGMTWKENVHYIQIYRGDLIMRTWCYRMRKNGEFMYSEHVRRTEDLKPVFCNINYGYLSGWLPDYGREWSIAYAYEGWNTETGYLWGKIINAEEIKEKIDPHHSYDGIQPFFEYMVKLKHDPRIEYLSKNGYGNLINSMNLLNEKGRNIAEILKVDPKWTDYLKGKGRNYLIACRRYKTVEEVERYVLMACDSYLRHLLKYVKDDMKGYLQFESRPGYDCELYKDYLDAASTIGYPLNERKHLFPSDLRAAHDEAINGLIQFKAQLNAKEFAAQMEKLSKYTYENGVYLIRPAADNGELIYESEQLHHCVRTYAEKHAKGLTAIFFIRQLSNPGKPYVTLELNKKHVVQIRADHNTRPEPEVLAFVDQWKGEFNFT